MQLALALFVSRQSRVSRPDVGTGAVANWAKETFCAFCQSLNPSIDISGASVVYQLCQSLRATKKAIITVYQTVIFIPTSSMQRCNKLRTQNVT